MKKVFEEPIAELIMLLSDEIMGTDENVISGDNVDYEIIDIPNTQALDEF